MPENESLEKHFFLLTIFFLFSVNTFSATLMERSLNLAKEKEIYMQSPQRFSLSSEAALQKVYYSEYVIRKIEKLSLIKLPVVARKYSNKETRFRLTIGADGEIQNIEILSSSGIEEFDQSIIEVIQLVAPFISFPTPLADELDSIEVVQTARYGKSLI